MCAVPHLNLISASWRASGSGVPPFARCAIFKNFLVVHSCFSGKIRRKYASAYLGQPGNRRVLRGGSWNNNQNNARAAFRNHNHPDNRNNNNGFRVVGVRRSTPYLFSIWKTPNEFGG